jgi:hypothetical protein
MSDLGLVRKEFVKQILTEEGKELHDNQGKAIAKLLHFHSNRLMDERPYSVSADDSLDGKFSIKIPGYGRALDIKPKNRVIQEQDKYTHWRQRRRTKTFPVYNRFMFGHYYTIAWRLMYGLTEEVAAGIKKQFKTQQ